MAANFSLPITAQSTPSVPGTGGGFGQPSAVSIGPAAGGFGGVAGTHPGSTFQAVVNPRQQVRFQVQPQVTVVVKPVFPLPETDKDSNGARRKDFLMTVNSLSSTNPYDSTAVDLNKYRFQGQVVCTIQQANVFLEKVARLGVDDNGELVSEKSLGFSELEMYMYKRFRERAEAKEDVFTDAEISGRGGGFANTVVNSGLRYPEAGKSPVRAASIPEIVCDVFHPLGVYNSRGTHNAMESFSGAIPHNNVNHMLGVNISNYSFMRDIWGVSMRAGDLLELVAYSSTHPTADQRLDGHDPDELEYHVGNGNYEEVTFVQFQPMCGLQYCQVEDFFLNDTPVTSNPGFTAGLYTPTNRGADLISDYRDNKGNFNGNLYLSETPANVANPLPAADVDISGGSMSISYNKDFLRHVFPRPTDEFPHSFVRLPIARLWVSPLHQPFMHKKAMPSVYKQDFNMVGYNAGRSDAEASLDSDWIMPNQNVGNLVYNKSKEFHNIEVELLCSHMEVF